MIFVFYIYEYLWIHILKMETIPDNFLLGIKFVTVILI